MSTKWYTHDNLFIPGELVKAEEMNSELAKISLSLRYLPEPIADGVNKGFSGPLKVGSATENDHALTAEQATGIGTLIGVDTGAGTTNNYLVTVPFAPSAYKEGMEIVFKALSNCTGASTVNVNNLGVVELKTFEGLDLSANDIAAGRYYRFRYNSGVFYSVDLLESERAGMGLDTYMVKRNAADSPGYLDDKVPLKVMELPDVTSERIIGSASGFDLVSGITTNMASYYASCDGKTIADGTYVISSVQHKYLYLVTNSGVTQLASYNLSYRDNQAIAVVGNYLYHAVGDSSYSGQAKLERYDPTSNTWVTLYPSGTPPDWQLAGGFEHDGLFWLAGKTTAYDPDANAWVDKSATNPNIVNFGGLSGHVTEEGGLIYGKATPQSYDPVNDTVTDLIAPIALNAAFYEKGFVFGIESDDRHRLIVIDQTTGEFVRQLLPYEADKMFFPVKNNNIHIYKTLYPDIDILKRIFAEI